MHHDLFAEVEIHVNLRSPTMGVRRKGIPHVALGQFGETHHELAALNATGVNVFVNHALVAFVCEPSGTGDASFGFIVATDERVRRTTQEKNFAGFFASLLSNVTDLVPIGR